LAVNGGLYKPAEHRKQDQSISTKSTIEPVTSETT
ncbi:hypothetical protein M5D96_012558, partial [Drosophila gunungcola]